MRLNCYKCMRPESSCMCSYVRPIQTNTKFVILMHPMERKKVKNGTGFLARRMLSNSEIIIDIDFSENHRVNKMITSHDCFVLYPSEASINLSGPLAGQNLASATSKKRKIIFILDATWPCAKKMLKLSKNLQQIPFVSFDNDQKSKFKIKQQPHELCLSTIESIKKVIDDLNFIGIENADTAQFLRPFEKMVEYQINCVESLDNNNHSSRKKGKLREREYYKLESQRPIFFEKS